MQMSKTAVCFFVAPRARPLAASFWGTIGARFEASVLFEQVRDDLSQEREFVGFVPLPLTPDAHMRLRRVFRT